MEAVFALHFGISSQIFPLHPFLDAVRLGGVDQRHAAALEACAAEPAAVDAIGLAHDLVQLDLLRRAGFPIMDAAPAGLKGQPAIFLQIPAPPGFRAGLYALELRVPMLTALRPLDRQLILNV